MLSMLLLALVFAQPASAPAGKYFTIEVVDGQTGRGVPLVELETVNNIRLWTDSNGLAAFHEPGLMGRTVFFHVKSHGYEFQKDGFGFRGKALEVTEGGLSKLALKRINIAERLYRVTGAGIYRDTVLLGRPAPTAEPLLNAQVFGSDSVVNAVYRGKYWWFWGDTNRPGYPLGNYNVPGAVSDLSSDGGLDPEIGVNLTYFADEKGFAKATAPMAGPGPTWIFGLAVVKDGNRERMFASYMKVRGAMETYRRGLCEWNDDKQVFEHAADFPLDAPAHPGGQTFSHRVGGTDYVWFATAYPLLRVKADAESVKRLADYEAFTCLKAGSRAADAQLDRADDGSLRWSWKKNTGVVGPAEQANLIRAGKMAAGESPLTLRDADTGKAVVAHAGSVNWNQFRRRWVMITSESLGTSVLGETWYAEADTPLGPWAYARKIVTHDRYSFYNPKHHVVFDKDGGRTIFFEGTYTNSFSGNAEQTPRYDYNQIMYKLDLADPRLMLPVPIYRRADGSLGPVPRGAGAALPPIAFFAPDRPAPGTIPIWWAEGKLAAAGPGSPTFHILPADMKYPPATTTPLYEFTKDGAETLYSVEESVATFKRADKPVGRVWRSVNKVVLPREE